jgi:ABC-type amino acid transport substrate-binding protein
MGPTMRIPDINRSVACACLAALLPLLPCRAGADSPTGNPGDSRDVIAATPSSREGSSQGGDLPEIQARGVLRHIGIPYAGFVTGGGDGLDVEIVRLFAKRLGVRYEFVQSDWPTVLPDLVGRQVSASMADPASAPRAAIRGDVVATGLTVLPWRERSVAFSTAVFPTQVWVMARADSTVRPIKPSGDVETDIMAVKKLLSRRSVLGVSSTCLDPALYKLDRTGAKVQLQKLQLDEVAPALIKGESELALLDVADAMIALQKWPGRIKVIGPISPRQEMAAAFRKDAPRLREAFDGFLIELRRDGTYRRLVKHYFPEAPVYFPEFFASSP